MKVTETPFATTSGWLVKCDLTCGGCPTVWEGKAILCREHGEEERELFIRFRYGTLRILVDDQLAIEQEISDGLDGIIGWDRVKPFIVQALAGVR